MAQPVTETVTQVVQEARVQVLAAKASIGLGQRLTPESVEWVDWPEGAVRPEYITTTAKPDAITEMNGAVARFEFFPGEPPARTTVGCQLLDIMVEIDCVADLAPK